MVGFTSGVFILHGKSPDRWFFSSSSCRLFISTINYGSRVRTPVSGCYQHGKRSGAITQLNNDFILSGRDDFHTQASMSNL
jgi:hypothetical protein